MPVFSKGASADENSLIAAGRSLFAENNYGYDLLKFNDIIGGGTPIGGDLGLVSEPGIARVDIRRDGSGCRLVWTNRQVRPASVVSKGDSVNGLLYTYENARDPPSRAPTRGPGPRSTCARGRSSGSAAPDTAASTTTTTRASRSAPPNGRGTLYLGGIGGIMALRDRS